MTNPGPQAVTTCTSLGAIFGCTCFRQSHGVPTHGWDVWETPVATAQQALDTARYHAVLPHATVGSFLGSDALITAMAVLNALAPFVAEKEGGASPYRISGSYPWTDDMALYVLASIFVMLVVVPMYYYAATACEPKSESVGQISLHLNLLAHTHFKLHCVFEC